MKHQSWNPERRILIVEDEPLVSMDISRIVEDTIPAVIIIKSSVAETKKVLDQEFDFALLDIDVTNGKTYQLAELLGGKKSRLCSCPAFERAPP